MPQVSTLSHRSRWGQWWRHPPRVRACDRCHVVAACWWVSRRNGADGTVSWRCVQCLPSLVTNRGRTWLDPLNPFAPRDLAPHEVEADLVARSFGLRFRCTVGGVSFFVPARRSSP